MAIDETKRSFLRNVGGTYGTQLVLLPLALGASVLQTRFVGADGRGQLSLVTTSVAFAVLYLGFGFSSSLIMHVASNRVTPRQLVRVLGILFLGQTTIFALILGLAWFTGMASYVIGSLSPAFGIPSVLVLFALTLVGDWMSSLLSARKDFGYTNLVSVFVVTIPLVGYTLGFLVDPPISPVAYVLGVLISAAAIRVVVLGARVISRERGRATAGDPVVVPLRAMITYSMLAYLCDATQFLTHRFDVWLVRYYRDDVELGRYSLAVSLAELVWLLASAFATVLFPHVPTLDRETAIRLTVRVAALTLVASVAFSLVGYGLAVPLLPTLFSKPFAPSVPMLGILLLGVAPYSVAKIVGSYIAGVGAMRLSLLSAVIGMIACVGLDFVLIPVYGARGAAAATAVAYLIFTFTVLALFKWSVHLPARQLLRYALAPLARGK